MSAIGEYIHLRVTNYYQYGTSRQGPNQPAIDSYNVQKNFMMAKINSIPTIDPTTLSELKARVQNEALQKRADEITKNTDKYRDNVDKFLKEVSDILEQEIPKAALNEGYTMPRLSQGVTSVIDLNRIDIYRERMYNAIDKINNNMMATQTDVEKVIENSNNFFRSIGIANDVLPSFLKMHNIDFYNSSTYGALKQLASVVPLAESYLKGVNGDFGEALVIIAGDTARELANQEVLDIMKATGGKQTNFTITAEQIPKRIGDIYNSMDGSTNIYAVRHSQDKVDAKITLREKNLTVSAKTTMKTEKHTAKLQGEVSLLDNLIMTQKQFANHWISLHSYNSSRLNTDRDAFDEELTLQIMYEALIHGNMLKAGVDEANTFVAINMVNGQVYTRSTREILQSKLINNIKVSPKLSNIALTNNTSKAGPDARIARIVSQLREKKLQVTFNVSFT